MTSLSFFVGIRLPVYQSPSPQTTPPRPGSENAVHTREEKYGPLSRTAATWKNPRKPPSCLWFLFSLAAPPLPPQLHVSLLLSGAGDIYARENYYFSISRSSQNIGLPHLPVLLIHSRLCPFLPALSVCHLLPSTSAISH